MKILIAGSGKMGTDIFYYLLDFSLSIVWLCLDESEKQKAESGFRKKTDRQLRAGLLSEKEYHELIGRVLITCETGAAADCALVIEAIWEDEEAKLRLFRQLDEILSPEAIITTNTSSIPVKRLIPSNNRKPFFCGLHFFFPVKLRNIIEINTIPDNDAKTLLCINDFLVAVDRRSILLPEGNHFLLNRLLLPLQNEAYSILQEGLLTAPEIDALVKTKIFPGGIFEFFDHVGIDIMRVSVKNYAENFPSDTDYSGLIACFDTMVSEGRSGVKSGQGFYQYPNMQKIGDFKTEKHPGAIKRLHMVFFETLQKALRYDIVRKNELEYAVNEYLGTDIIQTGKDAGYEF